MEKVKSKSDAYELLLYYWCVHAHTHKCRLYYKMCKERARSSSALSCRHLGACTLSSVKRILWFSWKLNLLIGRWELVASWVLSWYSTRTFSSFHKFCCTNSITIRPHKGEPLRRNLWQLLHLFINEASRGGFLRSVHEISSSDGGHQVWDCPSKLNSAFPII